MTKDSPTSLMVSSVVSIMSTMPKRTFGAAPLEVFQRTSFNWLLDLNKVVWMLELCLTFFAEVKVRAFETLGANIGDGSFSTSITLHIFVNNYFSGNWCFLNFFTFRAATEGTSKRSCERRRDYKARRTRRSSRVTSMA